VQLHGSLGREAATGRGTVFATRELLKHSHAGTIANKTFVIQVSLTCPSVCACVHNASYVQLTTTAWRCLLLSIACCIASPGTHNQQEVIISQQGHLQLVGCVRQGMHRHLTMAPFVRLSGSYSDIAHLRLSAYVKFICFMQAGFPSLQPLVDKLQRLGITPGCTQQNTRKTNIDASGSYRALAMLVLGQQRFSRSRAGKCLQPQMPLALSRTPRAWTSLPSENT